MKRCALLIIVLTAAVALAQTANSGGTSNQPAQTIVMPGTGVPGAVAGPSTNTGTAVIIAAPSAPLLVTPEVHLTTVAPSAGATNATPGNTAGAANATAALPVSPTVITTVPQYAGAAATVMVTPPPEQSAGPAPAAFNTGVGSAGTTGGPVVVLGNANLPFNAGVGSSNTLLGQGNTGGRSLGAIAREYRQQEAAQNARVYTNQDIDRMNQQTGGTSGIAIGAGNAAGTKAQPATSAPAVAQPTTTSQPNTGVSQPEPPQTKPAPPDQNF